MRQGFRTNLPEQTQSPGGPATGEADLLGWYPETTDQAGGSGADGVGGKPRGAPVSQHRADGQDSYASVRRVF